MIKVMPMKETDIADALRLWEAQFGRYCCCHAFPDFREGGRHVIKSYIARQIRENKAVVAKKEHRIVGYMAWMYFDFHKEKSAFWPTTGHAASLENEIVVYEEMYAYAAGNWVRDDRLNHLWMTYFEDEALKNRLYDMGFGSHVIDACQTTDLAIKSSCDYAVRFADMDDADALRAFVNGSAEFYASAPIFLKREPDTMAEIIDLIENKSILIALDGDRIVGSMSFQLDSDFHSERLTTPDSVARMGAYIDPNDRRKGIGSALLAKAFNVCRGKGKRYIHVAFETANANAMGFWPQYFKPAIRSVRRTINKDANS